MLNAIDVINKTIFELDPSVPICIYIGVGSAAHMRNGNILADEHYHQYPKFLEEMHHAINMVSFHILIDPTLEDPPFMVIDKSKNIYENIKKNDMYVSICGNHYVYSLKKSISILGDIRYGELDITEEMHILNRLAMEMNILLVYADYTGRSIKPIAKYFDEYIGSHLDHIIYGLGNRSHYECYIDLTSNLSKFAYIVNRNKKH